MEAKAIVRADRKGTGDMTKSVILQAVYLVCGILVSRGAVLGGLAPFGASFASAAPKRYLIASLIGTGFGYVLLNPADSFRYMAVIVSIGGLRWLLSDIDKVSQSRLFAPILAFAPMVATGIAMMFSSTGVMSALSDCIVEAVLAGAGAYFLSVAAQLSDSRRSISAYSSQESAAIVMSGCILILSFGSMTIYGISLGRIIAMLIVLLCARYGSVTGGSVAGISTGAVFSIASRAQGFICGGFAFGGLLAGLFSPLGKLACSVVFIIGNGVMCLAFGSTENLSPVFIESLVASVVFLVLPSEIGNVMSPVFSSENGTTLGEALRKNIVMRLEFASKAVANVRNDVNQVSDRLKKLYSPSFDSVCDSVEKEVCSGCGLKVFCHEKQQGITRDDFRRLEEAIEQNGLIDEQDVESAFVKKCCKKGEIADSVNANYREYLASLEAQRRITGVRSVVAGQFSGVSDILKDLSEEFRDTMRCDNDSADRVISSLSELGAIPTECVCLITECGRLKVELELSATHGKKLSKGVIMRAVSRACGRRFDLPTITQAGDRVRVVLGERPVYDVEIGSDQHIANGGKLCGDCLNYFNDGLGRTYALVCDGMGTGGRAAVDGNMAVSVMSRLLKSGLSADSSLQIVNSALMVKSEDESLSAIDLSSIDLFTGRVTLKKAGAPATYIKKGGRVTARELPSLPAGILTSIKFSTETVNLSVGDMVVMVSDGVLTGDDKWLESLIRTWNEGSAQELAQAVVAEAIRRRKELREDDITAVAVRITENE